MAEIALRGVTRTAGRRYVLDNVDMTMRDGELTALVGDRECGKVTALKVIAGIEKADSGDIFVAGAPVTHLKGGRRDVAMVFEKQGLLPHKNVFDNIAFPLRMAKIEKAATRDRVLSAARRFGLENVLDRKPRKLDEAQRHLIGIARAVVRNPAAYLFQAIQPKSAASLRKRIVGEMVRLVREDGATVVYATEDGGEALRIADRIIVMAFGAVAQSGSPRRIYRRPADTDIAELFGAPPINLLPGKIIAHSGGVALVRLHGGSEISLPADAKSSLLEARVTLGIRPPHVKLEETEGNNIAAKIRRKNISNGKSILLLDTAEGEITASVDEVERDEVTLHLPADYCLLFDSEGRAIRRAPPTERTDPVRT